MANTLMNNQNTNNVNEKERVQMTNTNLLTNGGNNQQATNLFEAFINGGIAVKAVLPVGEHKGTFQGLDVNPEKMTFTVKFNIDGKLYEHTITFKPEKTEQITWTFQAIARQLGMDGAIAFADYNNHKDKPFTVWAVKVEGYSGVFYNYRKPATVTEAPAATTVTNEEF